MPGPGPHLRGGAPRAPASRAPRQGRHEQGAEHPRPPRAGGVHGRDTAHDRLRHPRHQRHRAGHRLPAPPFSGRVLRARQGQDPLLGKAALLRPGDPLPRLLARLRVRSEGSRVRAHRPAAQAPRHRAAAGARAQGRGQVGSLLQRQRGDPRGLLQDRSLRAQRKAGSHPPRAGPLARGDRALRPRRPGRQRHRGGGAADQLPSRGAASRRRRRRACGPCRCPTTTPPERCSPATS